MADVTIRGAGVIGLTLAWECLRRGVKVLVIDPNGPGAGSSGGVVGALAPHVPENWNAKKAFQLDSLLLSRALWPEIEAASGLPTGYVASGRLQPLADDRAVDLARLREHSARDLWAGYAAWQVVDAGDFAPWLNGSPTGMAVHDTLSAQVHPRLAVAALASAVAARGGSIVPDGRETGSVVHCTGWDGLQDLGQALGRTIGNGVKGQAALLDFDAGAVPQLYVDGLHVIAHPNGTVAIGSTSEREFVTPDQTDTNLDDLIARARTAVPQLGPAPVLARWAGVRPRALSRAPLMGRWPDRPGHFVSNGGFKIGFGMAPAMARVMADLILDGHDAIPDEFRLA